jgi:hypothetical protein
VQREMVAFAQRQHVVLGIGATFGARHDVMLIDVSR